jgi:hypothetical protein
LVKSLQTSQAESVNDFRATRLDAESLSRLAQNCKLFRACLSASGLQFCPSIGVSNDKLLVMKCGVAPKHQPTGVTPLEFHKQFLVFLF